LAPSTFYYHRNKAIPIDAYLSVRPLLREIFDRAYRAYGYRRVRLVLASKHNIHLSGKTVLKLMHQENRRCQVRRRKYRSYQGQIGLAAQNLLDRDFFTSTPNSKWVTDVTEFRVLGQKQYLSPVIDLFNGEVISYQLSSAPALGLVTTMLDKALATLDERTKPIIHSDQGWHYRHMSYRKTLEVQGIKQSMSRKGNCLDNAVAENFFGHFKEEFLRQQTFTSIKQFKIELDAYIHWFNHDRIRLKLKGLSPVDYRTQSLANIGSTPN
jgi:putative transposase